MKRRTFLKTVTGIAIGSQLPPDILYKNEDTLEGDCLAPSELADQPKSIGFLFERIEKGIYIVSYNRKTNFKWKRFTETVTLKESKNKYLFNIYLEPGEYSQIQIIKAPANAGINYIENIASPSLFLGNKTTLSMGRDGHGIMGGYPQGVFRIS